MPDNAPDDYLDDFLSSAFASAGTDSDLIVSPTDGWPSGREEPVLARIGPYAVTDRIGSGGVGTVYRAVDDALGREVAIKVLREKYAGDPKTVERFVSEARLCAQLTHPGVVSVHEVGELEDRRPYFAMRLIEGQTFAARIASARESLGTPGALTQIFAEFESLCRTLASVHEQNVVHGDLKPHNVMVGPFGEVQLMDWGFARRLQVEEEFRRGGTPAYMAPEQASGAKNPVTLRTDVFGLGAILCEVLTGYPPYRGREEAEVVLRAKGGGGRPELEERLRSSGQADELVELVFECLALDPADRPADAGVVAARLHAVAVARERSRRALEIDAAESRARAVQERRARRLTLALAVSVVLGALIAGAGWLWAERESDARRTHASRTVERALRDVSVARLRAVAEKDAPVRAWTEVKHAASRLRDVSDDEALDTEARVEALTTVTQADGEAEAAIRRIQLLGQLDDLRPHFGEDRAATELDARYSAAFANAGIDVGQVVEGVDAVAQIAATVAASPIREALVESLDRWTHFRRKRSVPTAESWREVHDIAARADADPWRCRLRSAFAEGDRAALLAMAGEIRGSDDWTHSPAALDFLAESLVFFGQRRAAVELYRRGLLRFPDDYVLTHHLAVILEFEREPPRDEIMRLAWAGVALRPHDAHALTDLGRELAIAGDTAAAVKFLGRAISIQPSKRALMLRGNLMVLSGQHEESLDDLARADAMGHPLGAVIHGLTLTRLARLDAAIESFRRATDAAPEDAQAKMQLGRVLCKRGRAGDTEAGLAILDRAIELDPDLAEAHCNRGLALRWLGRFDESLVAMRRGHELGTGQETWVYASDAWVQHANAFAQAARAYDAWREVSGDVGITDVGSAGEVNLSLAGAPPEVLMMIAVRRRDDALAWQLAGLAKARALDELTPIAVRERQLWFDFALAGVRISSADRLNDGTGRVLVSEVLDAVGRWTELEVEVTDEGATIDDPAFERGTPEALRFRYNEAMTAFGSRLENQTFPLEDGRDAVSVWRERVSDVENLLEGN